MCAQSNATNGCKYSSTMNSVLLTPLLLSNSVHVTLQWKSFAPQISINTCNSLMHPLQKAKCMPVCLQVQQVTTGVRDHNWVVKTKFELQSSSSTWNSQELWNMLPANHRIKVVSFLPKHVFHIHSWATKQQININFWVRPSININICQICVLWSWI